MELITKNYILVAKLFEMNDLKIPKKVNTPEISFIYNTGDLRMSGRAHPENVEATFSPILDWIESYVEKPVATTTFKVDLEYYNSSASKNLMRIFSSLIKIKDITKLQIQWYYYDMDSKELALDFEALMEYEIEKISKED